MEEKHYLILCICIVLIIQGLVSASSALTNQAIVNSSYSFDNFTESNCRGCHSSGVVDRHHTLAQAGTYSCMDCHPVVTDSNGSQTTIIVRDCLQCHGTTFYNRTLPLPHQKCISCHVENTYNISNISIVDRTAFSQGGHVDINNSDGSGRVNNSDCWTCHFNKNMNTGNINRCENCHTGAGRFGAPIVSEHNENGQDIKTAAKCILCHSNNGMYLDNNGTNGTTSAVVHYIKNVTNMATTPYLHNGPINTSNCIDCHNGAYTNNASWGSPVDISTSTKRTHTETQTGQCDLCHNDGTVSSLTQVDFHNSSLRYSDSNNCLGCHTTISTADLGLHSNLNGTSAVENGDCKTCHYGLFQMVKGSVNNNNTYFCADCHTVAGNGTNKTGPIFTEKKHGKSTCIDCHIADGKYHQGNPRGSVANSTYVNMYTTTNTYTDCADCHYSANLDDAPFNAPGGGSHIINLGGSCSNGGGSSCHAGGSTLVQTIHSLSGKSQGNKPAITVPTLNSSIVMQGSDVTVNATVSISSLYELVDGAQYRIMFGATVIRSWTPMSAIGGNFGGTSTGATASISTNLLSPGTYSVEVRGMAGGPAQNPAIRYYPMNGDISATQNITLAIIAPQGYINGTVKSNGVNLSGVTVSTSDASDVTGPDGKYSLKVSEGTYSVTASKQPTHSDNTITGIVVTRGNTTFVDFTLAQKPTGTISGTVSNA